MGHSKRKRAAARDGLVTVSPATPAERHTFSAGLLGHDLTASAWLVNVSEQTALGVDAFYACVRLIADAVAGADVGQWRGTERIGESPVIRRPMASMTRREWLWRVAATLAIYNLCYLQDIGEDADGLPLSIRPLSPTQVTWLGAELRVDGEAVNPATIRVWRRAIWPSVTAELGTVLALGRETFGAAMAADAYRSDFWQQGGAPVLVLSTDQAITDTDADAIADRWVTKRTTSPGRPAVLGKGAHADPLGADLGTEGAGAAGDKLRAAIARYMGVPADMVNAPTEAGSLTYSTTEQHGLNLVRYTLGAYVDTIGDGLSEVLPGDLAAGERVVLGLRHLTQAEQLSRFQAWHLALESGWMTRAEVRAAEGLAPDAGLDDAGTPAPAIEAIT